MTNKTTDFALSPLEKKWILYDVGNSAFTLLISAIFPIYFSYLTDIAGLSDTQYLAYWGYGASISTLIVAFIGPILGSFSDLKGLKKILLIATVLVGTVGTVILGFAPSWIIFIVIFVIAKIGYSSSLIVYDSMLPDITTPQKMDKVSSYGYAWGYVGSCIPFIASLGIVLFYESIGISFVTAIAITFIINALWWGLMTVPLLKAYKQTNYVEYTSSTVSMTFVRLKNSVVDMYKNKKVFYFLIAYFFYIDAVYTIIEMSTAYGESLGLDTTGLLLALLMTQLIAFPSAIIIGRLSRKYKTPTLISICIIAYTLIAIYAIFLDQQYEFWILAGCVGLFQGGIQGLSRSYFGQIIPAEKSGEYFGIFDICGKGAVFLGTTLVSVCTQLSGSSSVGVMVITPLILIGFFIFRKSLKH